MRDKRSKMDDVVFVNCDLVKSGDARNINEGIDPFADAALEFEDQVSAASNNAGAFLLSPLKFL